MSSFCFATGIIIGVFGAAIGFLVVLYLQFIKAEEDMCDCYARGFDDGREWRRHEVEWAQDEIAEIKRQIKGLNHED